MAGNGEIDDFLGSAHIFAAAVREVVEQRLLDRVAAGRVTVAQVTLLKLVAMTTGYTLGDVAAFLNVSNAAASRAVDRLVRHDLLRRSEAPLDRRNIHLVLTKAGRQLLAAYEAARRARLDAIFGGFPRAELHQVSDTLDRISARIVDSNPGPDEPCLKCGIYFREKCLVRELVQPNCFYRRAGRKAERKIVCA